MKIDVSKSPLSNYNDNFEKNLNTFGLFCMSQKNDDILMWSHYADSHKGICFGFKEPFENHIDNDAPIYNREIEYIERHPYIDIYNDIQSGKVYNSNDEFKNFCDISGALLNASITKKHVSWKYEQEIRIVYEGGSGPLVFKPEALECVILGMNITKADEMTIGNLLKQNKWSHAKIYKSKASVAELGLDIIEHPKIT